MPWAKEGNTMTEGPRDKVQTHRIGKSPLLGRGEEEGQAAIGNSLCWSTCLPTGLEVGVALQRLWVVRSLLLIYGREGTCASTGGQAPIVWAKGIRGLSATWCLLHNLQVSGTDCGCCLRCQREA